MKIPDTIKKNWFLYFFILLLSLSVHILLFLKTGPCPSTDFHLIYMPAAAKIVGWLKGSGSFPYIPSYQLFHLGYILLAVVVFLFFGTGNLTALIAVQVLISVPVFLFIFHISLTCYHSRWVALIFTVISVSFFDNIMWATWAVPDSFYRALFVPSYFILPVLYYRRRFGALALLGVISFIVLLSIRIETIILILPLIWLTRRNIFHAMTVNKTVSIVAAMMLFAMGFILYGKIFDILRFINIFYVEGLIISGTGQNVPGVTNLEPYNYDLATDIYYNLGRFMKLFLLRLYYFFNVFPPFWSFAHRIYYAFYMLIFYLLAIAAIIRTWKERDYYFSMFVLLYLLMMLVQALTFVDAEKRLIQSVLPFFIMFAGYGFDYVWQKYVTDRRMPEAELVTQRL